MLARHHLARGKSALDCNVEEHAGAIGQRRDLEVLERVIEHLVGPVVVASLGVRDRLREAQRRKRIGREEAVALALADAELEARRVLIPVGEAEVVVDRTDALQAHGAVRSRRVLGARVRCEREQRSGGNGEAAHGCGEDLAHGGATSTRRRRTR